MLKIYTSKETATKLSKLVDIVEDVEAKFLVRSAHLEKQYTDEDSIRVLKEIEGMQSRKDDYIVGKFGTVSLLDISTGGKGCLLASTYNNELVISTDEMGYNCIFLLFELSKHKDIEVLSTRFYSEVPQDAEAIVDGQHVTGDNISDLMEVILDD